MLRSYNVNLKLEFVSKVQYVCIHAVIPQKLYAIDKNQIYICNQCPKINYNHLKIFIPEKLC